MRFVLNSPRWPLRRHIASLSASSTGSRIASGALLLLLGAAVGRALNLVAMVSVARMLGRVGFGELGILLSTVGVFQVIAGFGLGMTATRYVALYREGRPQSAGHVIALSTAVAMISGLAMGITLFVGAPFLATHTLAAPELTAPLRLSSLMLLLGALNGANNGALAGFEAFKVTVLINVLVGMVSFVAVTSGAYFAGLGGAVLGLVGGLGFECFLSFFFVRRVARESGVPLQLRGSWAQRDVLAPFALPSLLSSLFAAAANWGCGALLVNRPGGYAQMGVYSAANQWFTALILIPTTASRPLLPVLAERLGKGDAAASLRVFKVSTALTAAVVVPVGVLASVGSPWIMGLYGTGYASYWAVLVLILATAFMVAVQIPAAHVVAASGRMWVGLMMNIGWGVVLFISVLALIPKGAFGLALGRAVAYGLHSTWAIAFAFAVLRSGCAAAAARGPADVPSDDTQNDTG